MSSSTRTIVLHACRRRLQEKLERVAAVLDAEERDEDREHDENDSGPEVDLQALAVRVRLVGRDEGKHEEGHRQQAVCERDVRNTWKAASERQCTHR